MLIIQISRCLDPRIKLCSIKDYSSIYGLEALTPQEKQLLEGDLLKVFSRELTRLILNCSVSSNWPEELKNQSTRKETIKKLKCNYFI